VNFVGRVGPEWQVERIGDFTIRCTPGILFQRGDGALMIADVVSNGVTSSAIAGQLGAGWLLYGIGDYRQRHPQQRRARHKRSHCQPSDRLNHTPRPGPADFSRNRGCSARQM